MKPMPCNWWRRSGDMAGHVKNQSKAPPLFHLTHLAERGSFIESVNNCVFMKNIQFTSPATDREFFISLYTFLFCLGLFGFAGYQISIIPVLGISIPALVLVPVGTLISAGLGGFVWGMFNIFEPTRHHRNWAVIKYAGIPLVWLMLALVMVLWLQHMADDPSFIYLEELNKKLMDLKT